MEEPSETNHLLQLQLRAGNFEVLERVLRDLRDQEWFQDEHGWIWQWGYDIDANLHRWFLQDPDIVGLMVAARERKELDGAPRTLSYYGWGPGLYYAVSSIRPYQRVEWSPTEYAVESDPVLPLVGEPTPEVIDYLKRHKPIRGPISYNKAVE